MLARTVISMGSVQVNPLANLVTLSDSFRASAQAPQGTVGKRKESGVLYEISN